MDTAEPALFHVIVIMAGVNCSTESPMSQLFGHLTGDKAHRGLTRQHSGPPQSQVIPEIVFVTGLMLGTSFILLFLSFSHRLEASSVGRRLKPTRGLQSNSSEGELHESNKAMGLDGILELSSPSPCREAARRTSRASDEAGERRGAWAASIKCFNF